MALQTENRALIGLGVFVDAQPDSQQPLSEKILQVVFFGAFSLPC